MAQVRIAPGTLSGRNRPYGGIGMDAADCRRLEGTADRRHCGNDIDRAVMSAETHPEAATTVRMRSVSPDDRVADVIALAAREHLRLVTNGSRFALCSAIPAGWRPFGAGEYTPDFCH